MDIAALIADPNTTITLPGTVIATLLATIQERTSERDTFKLTAESLDKQLGTVTEEAAAAHKETLALKTQVQGLEQALRDATKPPVIIPPTIPSPLPANMVIDKTQISGVAALTIEKSLNEPDDTMYTDVRNVLRWAGTMGFNLWRGFFNADEVRKHQSLKPTDPNHLPAFGRNNGVQFVADTVATALKTLDSKGQREYLKGLEAMGALAVVFNDVNDELHTDLQAWTDTVRAVLPKMPIIASLKGNAKTSDYPMFDLFEAQTFGSRADLTAFLERAFNIFCLDARKGISATDLTVRAAIVLAANPKAFFYYADTTADWLNMPLDKQGAIRSMIAKWKALRP